MSHLNPPVGRPAHVAIVGGGLAGLATALALGSSGYRTTVLEARPFLGGRATSYALNNAEDGAVTIDNCQHILLRCCTNLIDFYRQLGVDNRIHFYRDFFWIEPGGRVSVLKRGLLPAPFHFTESFARLRFLSLRDKIDVARGLRAVKTEYKTRTDLDQITMLAWLREKRQGPVALERFWRQVLLSAINEELDRMAASHALQVFWLGFLARSDSYEMGVPNVPLAELYSQDVWAAYPSVEIRSRAGAQCLRMDSGAVFGVQLVDALIQADVYVSAVPFERLTALVPQAALDLSSFQHSPITGIHLWFDRPITDLPHATLLDLSLIHI